MRHNSTVKNKSASWKIIEYGENPGINAVNTQAKTKTLENPGRPQIY